MVSENEQTEIVKTIEKTAQSINEKYDISLEDIIGLFFIYLIAQRKNRAIENPIRNKAEKESENAITEKVIW